ARTVQLLERMGVPDPAMAAKRYPHQLSGGLRQRAMIAMALSCTPALLIADEPTTALDVTVQAQILTLLREIREEGAGVMLITHDMGVVAQACTHVAVMYSGLVVENGPVRDVLDRPLHPYTQALLAAIPPPDGPRPERLPTIPGQPPTPDNRPTGCVFAPRCSFVRPECAVRPPLTEIEEGRRVACVLYAA
ncbi:MAG: ABC transporter ATP-binding protein, partial [Gluconobacter sp.]